MTIGIQGLSFTQDGHLATYAGQDAFRLLDRFIRGEDIGPVLQSCQALIGEVIAQGMPVIPVLRVFAVLKNICALQPSMYPGRYYSSVSALSDYVYSGWGGLPFIIDWDANADEQDIEHGGWGWSRSQQQDHWGEMIAATRGRQTFLTAGNEGPKNGWNAMDLWRPDGIISSKGSNLGGEYPPANPWSMHKYHPRRDGVKGIAACGRYVPFVAGGDEEAYPTWPHTTVPVVTDEWIGAADQDDHGRRTSWPDDHYRAGFDVAAWGAGGVFHSDCGLQTVPYTDRQFACGIAYMMGLSKADPVQRFQGVVR